ncbi:MAG: hypothetical protein JW725_03130 [Candidatus Babeliaceae bacterium]|nr:hypothetical protein [Candidatus Babeliaceae bacterium]
MNKLIGLSIFIVFLVGCTVTQPQPKVMRYATEIFQPTNRIEIIHTKPVNRDYIEIGEVSIQLKKSTEENAEALLAEKAKELGANALIIIGERSKGAVVVPIGNMAVAVPLRELYGIAIKYK